MNILVTGATGFVGAHLAKRLLDEKNDVVTIVHDLHPKTKRTLELLGIDEHISKVNGSITDLDLVKRVTSDYEIDLIYHLAALPIVRVGNVSPVPIWDANIRGTWNVMEAAKECNSRVFYLSTDKVYGHHGNDPYEEHFALNGLNIYESSKACADNIVRSYAYVFGIKTAIVRSCNIYGPADFNSRLIPNSIRKCLAGISPTVYDGIDYVREWIFVADAISAFIKVAENISEKPNEVYNVGTGFSADQREVIRRILLHFEGIEYKVEPPQSYMHKEIPYQVLSAEKIRTKLDWTHKVDFDAGLKIVVDWWKEHSHLI